MGIYMVCEFICLGTNVAMISFLGPIHLTLYVQGTQVAVVQDPFELALQLQS
jgi:hypothetical protein